MGSKFEVFRPEPLGPDTLLWRIMNVSKLSTLLRDHGLWFSRLDQFGDPLEGQAPVSNLGLLSKYPANAASWVVSQYGLIASRSYAMCWHINDSCPSDNLWGTFGGPEGIAVTSTPAKLFWALGEFTTREKGPIYIGRVQYIDHENDAVPEGNLIYPTFAVRTEFQPENEARVLICTDGSIAYEKLYNRQGRYGWIINPNEPHKGGHLDGKAIVLEIDPAQLICKIHRGPKTTDYAWDKTKALAAEARMEDKLTE